MQDKIVCLTLLDDVVLCNVQDKIVWYNIYVSTSMSCVTLYLCM